METQLKEQTSNRSGKSSVALIALFRLALLVGPETLLVRILSHSPVICVLAAFAFLAIWLSVDVWPFRVTPAVPAAKTTRPVAKTPAQPAYAQNLNKAQWISHLFCRVIIFYALFHSKLTI